MKRDLNKLSSHHYDLCIIGGGIYGACVAWDAVLRGLSVVLVEKNDFASATSANSLKIIHGGLRYLQHGDIKRMRESIREQRILMQIAPHLIHPLPVIIPTYGHGIKSKEILSIALFINRLVAMGIDQPEDPIKHFPKPRTLSKEDILNLLPGLHQKGLTGGVVFYDAQVHNSERFLFSYLKSADKAGADLANYVEIVGFLRGKNAIIGVKANDVLSNTHFDISARVVVNTSGPWIDQILDRLNGNRLKPRYRYAKAINVITPLLFDTYAVGISARTLYRDSDAVIKRGHRLLFFTPWRGYSLIGTAYETYDGNPNDCKASDEELERFVAEINDAYPIANLSLKDLCYVHSGLLPLSGICSKTGSLQLGKRYEIYDHQIEGLKGLVSVMGVKFTTARVVAEKVVNCVSRLLGRSLSESTSSRISLYGGQIKRLHDFVEGENKKQSNHLDLESVRHLIDTYGSSYLEVFSHLDRHGADCGISVDRKSLIKAEVLHGIRSEMAQKLSDVVFRRTELGTAGCPSLKVLQDTVRIMAEELGWGKEKQSREIDDVLQAYSPLKPLGSPS